MSEELTHMNDAVQDRRNVDKTDHVQSLIRAMQLLEHMADAGGGVSISQLATVSGLPLPTVYRLLRTLVSEDYVRRGPSRRYLLGPRLIRLGESAGLALGEVVKPFLKRLVEATGETANLGLLDGNEVVYIGQAPSKHSVRMFTEVGRRLNVHCTGVGKALLAQLSDSQVRAMMARTGMPAQTPATITDPERLLAELRLVREQGYAADEGEQEVGVRCFAVAVVGGPALMAISVSGPAGRMDNDARRKIVPVMLRAAAEIAEVTRTTSDKRRSRLDW